MALSDACSEFISEVDEAARRLAEAVHWYAAPGMPLSYGEEIDALRRACAKVDASPLDPEARAELLRLAVAVLRYLDTPPDAPQLQQRRSEMETLIRLLQAGLSAEDAAEVPAVIKDVAQENERTAAAAARLRAMLSKLGKPAYDVAIKVISDIASATAKRFLGL
ncbi:DUF2321 domain-containing protein [Azospirillum argentinense]|uniref:DUF2321 domain-containing protein n=1 Tax=Azospirillum argentinense TaxID=2970906 RepID=UPI0011858145|nr:DUF2321 domain-containing protein [Azospirillum argentinense]